MRTSRISPTTPSALASAGTQSYEILLYPLLSVLIILKLLKLALLQSSAGFCAGAVPKLCLPEMAPIACQGKGAKGSLWVAIQKDPSNWTAWFHHGRADAGSTQVNIDRSV
jgi:hypothetical protein